MIERGSKSLVIDFTKSSKKLPNLIFNIPLIIAIDTASPLAADVNIRFIKANLDIVPFNHSPE